LLMPIEKPSARRFATFLAFVVAGWTPLLPYALAVGSTLQLSVIVTALAFFVVGASRSLVTDKPWYTAGGEMFVVGMIAAAVAFGAGVALRGVA